MGFSANYLQQAPTRAEIDTLQAPAVLEFGTSWCGHCQAAHAVVEQAFAGYSDVLHLRVEDGPGRRLGRTFGVKLWPTLLFLRGGVEVARLVRPVEVAAVAAALAAVAGE